MEQRIKGCRSARCSGRACQQGAAMQGAAQGAGAGGSGLAVSLACIRQSDHRFLQACKLPERGFCPAQTLPRHPPPTSLRKQIEQSMQSRRKARPA